MLWRVTFSFVALAASVVNATDDGRGLVVAAVGEPTWTLYENTTCGEGTVPGLEADSWEVAKAKCEELADSCFGVYDVWCQGKVFFLCDLQHVQAAEDLDISQAGSCVRQLTMAPAPDGGGFSPTFAPSPAPASSPAPGTLGTSPTDSPAVTGACWEKCTLPGETSARTCWEQILRYGTDGSGGSGSMPLNVEIPCTQRRMMVSHGGECQVCSSCYVCENSTSMAAFLLTGEEASAASRTSVAGTLRRVALVAAATATAAAAVLLAALRGPCGSRRGADDFESTRLLQRRAWPEHLVVSGRGKQWSPSGRDEEGASWTRAQASHGNVPA